MTRAQIKKRIEGMVLRARDSGVEGALRVLHHPDVNALKGVRELHVVGEVVSVAPSDACLPGRVYLVSVQGGES
jgi:hypothetical protein